MIATSANGWGGQKPPLGTPLNQGHPLASIMPYAWAYNEGAGGRCLATGGKAVAQSASGLTWAMTPGGVAALPPTSPLIATGLDRRIWQSDVSLVFGFHLASAVTNEGGRPTIFEMTDGGGAYLQIRWIDGLEYISGGRNGPSGAGFGELYNIGQIGQVVVVGVSMRYTTSGGSAQIEATTYANGRLTGNAGVHSGDMYGPSADMTLAVGGTQGGSYFGQPLLFTYIIQKYVFPSEIGSIARAPYQVFAPPAPWRFYSIPAGGIVTVATGNLWYYSMLGRGL